MNNIYMIGPLLPGLEHFIVWHLSKFCVIRFSLLGKTSQKKQKWKCCPNCVPEEIWARPRKGAFFWKVSLHNAHVIILRYMYVAILPFRRTLVPKRLCRGLQEKNLGEVRTAYVICHTHRKFQGIVFNHHLTLCTGRPYLPRKTVLVHINSVGSLSFLFQKTI